MILIKMELNKLPEVSLLVVALYAVVVLVHIILMLVKLKHLFALLFLLLKVLDRVMNGRDTGRVPLVHKWGVIRRILLHFFFL
jgi:hypothetical protein